MREKIKQLGSDTAVYGISTIIGRFLTFILTPIYTHVLRPDDLGVVATVFAYIAVLNVVYGYGMESAFMKYRSTLELGNPRQVFSVPFLSVGATAFLFSGALVAFASPVGVAISLREADSGLVISSALILFLDALALIPFASLRMEAKPKTFAAIKLAGIVLNVMLNLLFLFTLQMGVEGIFLSNVISSAATVAMLAPMILRRLSFRWDGTLYRALLRFGIPYVPAGLASMMIQVINRPIMEALQGKAAVGVFQANYRLGIFMMLIVSMYDFAWRPFFLSHAADTDAKKLFARILTYFILATTLVFLFLSFYLGDLVRLPLFWGHPLVARPYWGGLGIVPLILLAYLFLGVYNNLIAGVYIQKRTEFLPLVTFVGAGVNIAANYLLIPAMNLTGAALATLASYLVMAVLMYVLVQRIYPVEYELMRIGKIALAAGAVYAASTVLPEGAVGAAGKGLLLVLFVVLMHLMKFFVPSELSAMSGLLRRSVRNGRPQNSEDHLP